MFCHIYARRDGTFTVRMRGSDSVHKIGGVAEFISCPLPSEKAARHWIQLGRAHAGLEDMPEPKVIRRGRIVASSGPDCP